MNKIVITFTILALFVSCLGLLGLVAFYVEKQTKETGIRKVLGASGPGIFVYLSGRFMKWVILANGFAWPLGYVIMDKWLQNFAYRTNLNIWIFIISGVASLIIALLSISYQTIRAARANPVEALKYE